jgi:glycosyltransferase involved in cell wall biosynthesis
MPILTVSIPTFNRLPWLKRTLPEIIEQAQAFPAGEIEVVVSDNCSSDGTWEYLLHLSRQAEVLRLHRNEINIGGEANFYLLPQLTTGSYVWMIGDDDLVTAGALKRVVEALSDAPDYLVLNYDAYDLALQRCMRANSLRVNRDEDFRNPEECLSRIDAMAMSFISMWVGRREFFNLLSEERYRHFARWGMSIQADRYLGISRFPRGRLLAAACLRARLNTEFKQGEYFSWFLHGSAEVFRYAQGTGTLTAAIAHERRSRLLCRDALQRIRYERRTGQFRRMETYRLLRADYGDLAVFWLWCVPTMFAPGLGTMLKLARWALRRS